VAAAPDFATSGKVYVYYTDGEGDIRIDEFRRSASDPDIADPNSRRPVVEIPHRDAANHNGGTVQFGPDSCLWAATGDGGGGGDQFNNAQNLATLLGKCCASTPIRPGRAVRLPVRRASACGAACGAEGRDGSDLVSAQLVGHDRAGPAHPDTPPPARAAPARRSRLRAL